MTAPKDDPDGGESEASKPRRGPRQLLHTAWSAVVLVRAAAARELTYVLVLTVIGSALTAAELLVGRRLVQLITTDGGSVDLLVPWLALLGLLLIGTAVVSAAVGELRVLLVELVHRQAMLEVLEAATRAELEAFEDADFHNDIERAREHSDTHAWEVVWGLVTLLTTLLSALAVIGVLLAVAPVLVPIAALAYVPIALVGVRNTRLMYDLHYGLAELDRDRAYHVRLLTGRTEAKEVRAFGLARWLQRRHDWLVNERIEHTRRVVKRRLGLALFGSSVTSLVFVSALALILLMALDGRISVEDAAVAVVGLQQLSGRLKGLGDAVNSLIEGATFLQDFEHFRDRPQDGLREAPTLEPLPERPSRVTVDHVSYRYPAGTAPALTDVSLELAPGRVVAIVGPNGAGKSTLAKILCGLLPPSEGTMRWDGIDTRTVEPAELRERVAPVFQDFTRYEHTAHQTIALGDVDRIRDRDCVEEAARQAGVDGFVERLPGGYETRLSTSFRDGVDLSIGQWQRLAIARAFFRDAPVVVMDEPAASLDPRAERDLFDRLQQLGRDRMVVFVSHRFATVHRADHILVLLEGRVAEQGTHTELMALRGLYAELYELQAEQFD